MALAFDHPPGDEGCSNTGRLLQELTDVSLREDGVLMETQQVLEGFRFEDKPCHGMAAAGLSKFRGISSTLGLNP